MLKPETSPLPRAETTGLAVDHIGVAVHDLASEIAAWRGLGFAVSDPVALMGADAAGRQIPLGQSSAHAVFENSYIELSSPVPGSGNHLKPYLAQGAGIRIIVLAADDAEAAHAAVSAWLPETPAVRSASRHVVIDGEARTARFRWFQLAADIVPATLSAVVQHLTPELVFHASLAVHPNGARRITRILATGRAAELACSGLTFQPPLREAGAAPPYLELAATPGPLAIRGFSVRNAAGEDQHYRV